jgi:HEAT repeat protein
MKEQSLGNYLKDEDVEIRRAAALACAMKDAKSLVPSLIPLLGDREVLVKRAANLALRELTGQRFGEDQQAWQDWWNKQNR